MKSILLFPLLIASSVLAQEPDSSSAIFQLREAERNFARASLMSGRNAAFIENFAEESLIFTDTWITTGKQYWKERKNSPVVLKWEPELLDISESRDFGISTGPWEMQEYRPNTAPLATGYFLSVWKREPGTGWKVILDAGSSAPPPEAPLHKCSYPAGADKPSGGANSINGGSFCTELMLRENQFLNEWEKNPVASTYASFLAKGVRLQRVGHLPSSNNDTVKVWLARLDPKLIWMQAGCRAAVSGDLGFTYGFLGSKDNSTKPGGHYVRIWRKQTGGLWKITLEMMSIG